MVWTWNRWSNNHMWTEQKDSMSVTIRSCHANYPRDHKRRYEIGNFEYCAACDYCHPYRKPGRYTQRCSYVSVKMKPDTEIRLHFQCNVCKNGDVVTVKISPRFIMQLADDNWDREKLSEHLGLD